ncbi:MULTISPECIES: helix-turn-helix transcriptional regulator [unclassified Pseudomonas]|uniref:helix-turn-helix transcriptional regulator n=1 Tax=unclassified Pseudomonas TaxID=196821 RepID=UPI002449A2C2|nr:MULTISPECIES: helix-turn-helix transcriptional regulator [unclassified Pseudomonas]MDG9925454.1 helix-turn-helix domain-containing protein [Pseudomonas sp. GD04045]MDH0034105.1 helix-turn-helix domain-containing protein [Pseudomonas sp. GD04019]
MNRISELRRGAGVAQLALANELGWSQGRLSNYEAGRREPGLAECRAIVRALVRLGAPCTLDDVFPPEQESPARAA